LIKNIEKLPLKKIHKFSFNNNKIFVSGDEEAFNVEAVTEEFYKIFSLFN